MKRKFVDQLLFTASLVLGAALLAGAGLAWWGQSFATDQVKSQLVQEKIFFPAAGSPAFAAKDYPTLQKYAGTQIDNGDKAKAYADEYIWVHMMKASGGKTYAEVSELSRQNPTDAKLTALKNTLFQGDMLRSSLLTAYAFSRFGVIAHWAMMACLIGAGLMALTAVLLLSHLRRA